MAANRIAALASCQEYSKKRFIRDSKRDWQIAKIAMIAKIAGIENQSLNHKGHPVRLPFRKLRVAQGRLRNKKGIVKSPDIAGIARDRKRKNVAPDKHGWDTDSG
jgi:hypothetical protein